MTFHLTAAEAHPPRPMAILTPTDRIHSVVELAQSYIDRNLDDVELTPAVVARGICVSTRTLHRIFRANGSTVCGYIRASRLAAIRDDLHDPSYAEWGVAAIGGRWGLCDAAQLSRQFKARFGCSPTTYRARLVRRGEVEFSQGAAA